MSDKIDSSTWTSKKRVQISCNVLGFYFIFFVLCIVFTIAPLMDYANETEITEIKKFFRLVLGLVNALFLGSLIYSRTVLIVKSYTNHSLV